MRVVIEPPTFAAELARLCLGSEHSSPACLSSATLLALAEAGTGRVSPVSL
jgi:hypothetical protein